MARHARGRMARWVVAVALVALGACNATEPVARAPVVLQHPGSCAVAVGDIALLEVVALGDDLAYQWVEHEWDPASGPFGANPIAGARMSQLQWGPASSAGVRVVSCYVANPWGAIWTDPAKITVYEP